MMSRLGFGLDASNNPYLRIAYDNATDLKNEPASSLGKFQFDSFQTKLSYLWDIKTDVYDPTWNGGYLGAWYFFNNYNRTIGSSNVADAPTCGATSRWASSGGGTWKVYYHLNWWSFGYLPIFEWRSTIATNTYNGASVDYTQFNIGGFGKVISTSSYFSEATALFDANIYGSGNSREAYSLTLRNLGTNFNYVTSVFQLPARNDALPSFSTAPVSGQNVLLINPTVARLALPGRTVTDPNPDHYIFHENKIPAKIMKAGDVNVAGSGTATIICPLPLGPLTYMDFHVRKQTDSEFWNPPFFDSIASDGTYAFKYEVQSDRVVITNLTATPIAVRYVIFADSDAAYTSGGSKILLKGNDGAQDYLQIKRPGSSDVATGLNDIIIDTRLAYLPIIAEGFLNWTADFPTVVTGSDRFKGERMATVNFSNPDPKLMPFVKQGIVFASDSGPTAPITLVYGQHKVFTDAGSWTGRTSAQSSWANLHDTSVDFYMAGANPFTVDSGGAAFPSSAALGLRYYVFGIPQSL